MVTQKGVFKTSFDFKNGFTFKQYPFYKVDLTELSPGLFAEGAGDNEILWLGSQDDKLYRYFPQLAIKEKHQNYKALIRAIYANGQKMPLDLGKLPFSNNNLLFEHIKSFGYFKTQNYHNLIRFIEDADYQVYIIGHSCGLSDRTMLKEIFENEKCKSIKIFYYSKTPFDNDYIEKTMEISRHFKDKGLMRKKIVSFPLSKSLNHELFQK